MLTRSHIVRGPVVCSAHECSRQRRWLLDWSRYRQCHLYPWTLASSPVQRRKQRRLRSWWRHEQQSIAAALATFPHHSALRRQKARAGEGDFELNFTDEIRKTLPPQPELFSLYEEEPGGPRPPCLGEPPVPQARVQKHTMEQLADDVPMVQILDIPVPQMVEQVLEVFNLLDTQMLVQQVVAVPTISLDRVPQRLVERRLPQMVEQLMELPTISSPALLQQRTAEQLASIPVPRTRGGHRLHGFHPEQGRLFRT